MKRTVICCHQKSYQEVGKRHGGNVMSAVIAGIVKYQVEIRGMDALGVECKEKAV